MEKLKKTVFIQAFKTLCTMHKRTRNVQEHLMNISVKFEMFSPRSKECKRDLCTPIVVDLPANR